MKNRYRRDQGFTLLETLVVMGGGLIVLAVAMSLFTSAMKSALFAADRAELQQNLRTAINAITHDLSMAGSQMPHSGIQLASGAKFGCDQKNCGNYNFPVIGGNTMLYGVIPDPSATEKLNNIITIAYPDTSLAQCPIADSTPSGSQITLGACMTTSVPPGYYSYDDAGYGLKIGDIMLFTASGISSYAIGVITNTPGKDKGKLLFANSDVLNINQPSASHGNLATLLKSAKAAGVSVVASRLTLVTYYMQQLNGSDGKSGTSDDTYRLMRQVNTQTPVPVAENMASLQFSYDMFDETTSTIDANRRNANNKPDQIRKVNIAVEARSAQRTGVNKTQYMRLATSVEPRNLVYKNIYELQK